MSCAHELAKLLENNPDNSNGRSVNLVRPTIEEDNFQLYNKFYNLPSIDPNLQEKKPWKQDMNYFKTAYISSLALMKMCIHAQSGGSIEIMGMLIGKIVNSSIVVMDVYRLPVEGTETRVNAQNEAYEYMVKYLQSNQGLKKRDENIVGWYHSHPGYGCWLSGIDVSTQSLNQGFQDPYLAIVIDPVRTLKSGKVDIGAFRTYPDNYKPNSKQGNNGSKKVGNLPKSKRKDFGSYSDKYYSLDVEIFTSELDDKVVELLKDEDSLSWIKSLLTTGNEVMGIREKDIKSIELTKNYELSQDNTGEDNLFTLIEQLKKLNNSKIPKARLNNRKIISNFENVLYKKLLKKSKKSKKNKKEIEIIDDEIVDESDLEKNADLKSGGAGTASDTEDMISKDGDDDEDDEDENDEDEDDEDEDDEDEDDSGDDEDKGKEKGLVDEDEVMTDVDPDRYNARDSFDHDSILFEGSFDVRRRMVRGDSRNNIQNQRYAAHDVGFSRLGGQSVHEFMKASSSSSSSSLSGNRNRIKSRSRKPYSGGGSGGGDHDHDHHLHMIDQPSFDERLPSNGLRKDFKEKNQNLVKLAKSIGLKEVNNLIILETQEKLLK